MAEMSSFDVDVRDVFDVAGLRRSPATFSQLHLRRAPENKGIRYTPLTSKKATSTPRRSAEMIGRRTRRACQGSVSRAIADTSVFIARETGRPLGDSPMRSLSRG